MIGTDEKARVAVLSRCWASSKACWLSDVTFRFWENVLAGSAAVEERREGRVKRRIGREKEIILK